MNSNAIVAHMMPKPVSVVHKHLAHFWYCIRRFVAWRATICNTRLAQQKWHWVFILLLPHAWLHLSGVYMCLSLYMNKWTNHHMHDTPNLTFLAGNSKDEMMIPSIRLQPSFDTKWWSQTCYQWTQIPTQYHNQLTERLNHLLYMC